jgi:subtilisin family serine protease
LGITGAGILVGQSDSGVDGAHPELTDGYRKLGSTGAYSWYDPWNHSTTPVDVGGHGTHILGSVLGNRVGVAPDAEWIACVNLGRNLGNPAFYLDCMQFNFAPFPQNGDPMRDGKPEYGAQVLNNSWGCPPIEGCDPGALQAGVAALRAAGVFVVVSAGNDGEAGCGTVAAPPALYDEVFSVGAVNSEGNLASFSSLGPVSVDGSQRLKPDVVAPGVNVLSAFPGGAYASFNGTSMAGPHTAGVVALMWSANPAIIGDIERTEEILRNTARPYSGSFPDCVSYEQPNNAAGYGLIDAYAAVQAALAIKK